MNILAIESSADETAAAVVSDGTTILGSAVASSKDLHETYGGIVPEIASRKQLECIQPVIAEALSSFSSSSPANYHLSILNAVDAIAVTVGPGLVGSLLVGVETAKTISFVTGKPIIPVNHVIAHMYANFITGDRQKATRNKQNNDAAMEQWNNKPIAFPAISLVVSGGHTELYLMKSTKKLQWLGGTLDDAAGECFDKSARLLGFGNGGGSAIQEAAETSVHDKSTNLQMKLPRPMLDKNNALNFSFSGLKTAILREVNRLKTMKQWNSTTIHFLSFEVQEAITDVLVHKTLLAAKKYGAKSVLLSGGVSANTRLREKMSQAIQQFSNMAIAVPPVPLCTDNAVYIASCAYFLGSPVDWHTITAQPDLSVEI